MKRYNLNIKMQVEVDHFDSTRVTDDGEVIPEEDYSEIDISTRKMALQLACRAQNDERFREFIMSALGVV